MKDLNDTEVLPDSDVSDEELDIVVAQLRRITRAAGLECALRIGAVIIHHFYQGDTEAWRTRGPKVASFRRLSERSDLPFSPGALYRSVALFELCNRLHAVSRWSHLGASHLRLVLGLDPSVQERALSLANENRWTVRELHQALQREGVVRQARGGRKSTPEVTKLLSDIGKRLSEHPCVSQTTGLTSLDVEENLRRVREAQGKLEVIASFLNKLRETEAQRAAGGPRAQSEQQHDD